MSTICHPINTNATPTALVKAEKEVWAMLEQVADPEIPVISIVDLGIVRSVTINPSSIANSGGDVSITITPTYSGCPAIDMIATNIRIVLIKNGYPNVKITTALSPAWTTDWMTEKGKEKLRAYGIAPPIGKSFDQKYLEDIKVECPQCGSKHTSLISEFASTSCKALFQCDNCMEPFDYFKCH